MNQRKAVTKEVAKRYKKATKKEKAMMLDEFTATTGFRPIRVEVSYLKKKRIMVIGIVALIAALCIISFAVTVNANLTAPRLGVPTVWPKNANGVTYGSGLDAMSPEDEPDLIRVEATNGKEGYAYRTDLEGPDPSSPAAAVAQQKAKGGKPDIIPVYEVDGVTQIGVFLSTHNQSELIK